MGRTNNIINRFPDFYKSCDTGSVLYRFIEVFGKMLEVAENDLLKVMRSHWVNSADNEDSQGFNSPRKGDLDKIFSLYLENLGGTSQLRQLNRREGAEGLDDDEIYRQRIKGLINVLKSGASTKEGIIAIVAANLGIVGDSEEAQAAREQIRILEFLPEPYPAEGTPGTFHLFEEITIRNINPIDFVPEIRLRILDSFAHPLANPRWINLTTNEFVQFNGGVQKGDTLAFFPDGTAYLNGVRIPVTNSTPRLIPGDNRLRFETSVGFATGLFDYAHFDLATFNEERSNEIGIFDLHNYDEAVFAFIDPVFELRMILQKLSPGSFIVQAPWDFSKMYKITAQSIAYLKTAGLPDDLLTNLDDLIDQLFLKVQDFMAALTAAIGEEQTIQHKTAILEQATIPGFTETFDELPDDPRRQIQYIVNKVKAAGVFAAITYEKLFNEFHELADKFYGHAYRKPLEEDHTAVEANFDIGSMHFPYPNGIEHELSDNFIASGVFDYTYFDSLNTFA